MAATAGAATVAGCSQFGDGGRDLRDTDGDGVIDREDYAPRDASVQRPDQVREVDPAATEEPGGDGTESPTGTPKVTTIVDDFEAGFLSEAWHPPRNDSPPQSREAFEVQSAVSGEGKYALRGSHDGFSKYSVIQRDDFTVDEDGSDLRVYVKLGRVLSGSERANRIHFSGGSGHLVAIDQKDRPGSTDEALVGNGNTPDSTLDSLTLVELRDISFSDGAVGEVVVGGDAVATDAGFLNSGSEISSVEVYQGHFGQPDDVVVDGISYDRPFG